MQRLLLFDIDGTLLLCGRQVRRIFGGALEAIYGTAGDLDGYDFSGKIDPQIVAELLSGEGLSASEIRAGLEAMQGLYLERLEAELDAAEMTVLPGVERVLDRLTANHDVTLCLLTGNWRGGAYTKLARLGLDRHFATGAFGGDARERPGLLPVALERAYRLSGLRFAPPQVVVIGDSRHDVRCGLAHEVPVLAVTTGWTRRDQLVAEGATWVADSLDEGLELLASGL